jgi:hypothetical protein
MGMSPKTREIIGIAAFMARYKNVFGNQLIWGNLSESEKEIWRTVAEESILTFFELAHYQPPPISPDTESTD